MRKHAETARGIVLRQSLQTEVLPEEITRWVADEHAHLLSGKDAVDVLVLLCPYQDLCQLLATLARQLKPTRYYAHFVSGDTMYVVFPSCIVLVARGDEVMAQRARDIGAVYRVPDVEMKFEQLFEVDHPNVTA